MLGTLRTRRHNTCGLQFCALGATLLLLFSVFLLYSHLTTTVSFQNDKISVSDDPFSVEDPLFEDSDPELRTTLLDDRIDEVDVIDDESKGFNEEDIIRDLESEEENEPSKISSPTLSSCYYFDHVSNVICRSFDGQSVDEFDRWEVNDMMFDAGLAAEENPIKVAFGSDDVPVDEEVRRKVLEINSIEDALLLKLKHSSPLREGWGAWFDAKSAFLRKDQMFKSNLELFNPLNNMLLQDPDGSGVTGLTKGDKLMLQVLLRDMEKMKPLGFLNTEVKEANADHSA